MKLRRLLLLTLCCLPLALMARSAPRARIERGTPEQPILLVVETEADLSPADLDIQPLFRHFIVGALKFSHRSTPPLTRWRIALRPRSPEVKAIPALNLDDDATSPIPLATPQPAAPAAVALPQPVVRLNKTQVRVGTPLIYTLELPIPPDLQLQLVTPPRLEGASVEPLGDPEVREVLSNGQRLQIHRHQFVLIPHQAAAPAADVPLLGSLIQGQRPVTAQQQPESFTVRAPEQNITLLPSETDGLASRQLRLQEAWHPPQGPYQVGQAVVRSLVVTAIDGDPARLPVIPPPSLAGLRGYADQESRRLSIHQGELKVEQTLRQVVIPERAGHFVLPAVTLSWWNSHTGQMEQARLPEHSLDVAAPASAVVTTASKASRPRLPALLGALIGLSLIYAASRYLGLGTRFRKWRHRRAAWQSLRAALCQNSPQAAHRALLTWGRCCWPEMGICGVEQLPCYPALHKELDRLLAACFGPEVPWAGLALLNGLRTWRRPAGPIPRRLNPHGLA